MFRQHAQLFRTRESNVIHPIDRQEAAHWALRRFTLDKGNGYLQQPALPEAVQAATVTAAASICAESIVRG